MSNRELGGVHSRYAVRYAHAIFVLAHRTSDITIEKRNLFLAEAKFSIVNKDKYKTKYELESAMEKNVKINEARNKISELESQKDLIEGIAKGYDAISKAASREISRRIAESAPRD